MDTNVRLLVHAGASSTRHDDDQRVAQVAAYLDLDIGSTPVSHRHDISPLDRAGSEELNHVETEEPDSTTFIDDTQLAYTSLESQIFPASARTVGTVRPTPSKKRSRDLHFSSTAPAPSKPARLSDSPNSVLRPRSLEHESLIGPANVGPVRLEDDEQAVSAHPDSIQITANAKTQSTEHTTISNDTTSELPTSYSLGDIGEGNIERPQLSERSLSDPGPGHGNQDRNQEPSLQVQTQENPIDAPTDLNLHRLVVRDAGTASELAEGAVAKDLLSKIDSFPHSLSTSIQPAGPAASVEPFTTHITPALHKLEQNPDLFATFRPTVVERTLNDHERGHWEVQCSKWTPEVQTTFWETLQTVVGTGKAGWGVWCSRGPEVPLCSQSSQHRRERTQEVAEAAFGPVRIYCWGEVVKHIYLLMYVASNSRVRKLGLRWFDAQGSVVIEM